jgi:mono/diheme cytochrome c family protein
MKLFRALIFLSAILVLAACNFSLAADVTPPPGYQQPAEAPSTVVPATSGPVFPLVPPDAAAGGEIYAEKCAPCHGESGLGNGPNAAKLPNPVPPLGSPELSRLAVPAQWFQVVTQGNLERFMPPFRSLTDRQRWDVVAYVLSFSLSDQSLEKGADVYQENCASCHGEMGKGDGPDAGDAVVPDLTNQERMAGKSLDDLFQTINNGSEKMPAYGNKLAEEDRWALAEYLRTLTFASQAVHTTPLTPAVVLTTTGGLTETTPLTSSGLLTSTAHSGSVGGFVENASGVPVPAGTIVSLHAFDQMQLVYTATTTLEDDGSFIFQDVEVPAGLAFLATIEHAGIVYGSDVVTAEGDPAQVELPIRIFETTTDTSALTVDRLHYLMELADDKTLRVVELYVISNNSDRTVMATEEGKPVITYSLPADATNLQLQDGELGTRYVKTEDGFGDTVPVRPGQSSYQAMFSYELPFDRKLDLVRTANLPVQAVVILTPEGSISVKGNGIQDGGARDMQGAQYHLYNGSSLAAGDDLRLSISGGTTAGGAAAFLTGGSSGNLLIGLGALGIVLILAGVWVFWRGRPAASGDEKQAEARGAAQLDNPDVIMDAILALDDLYQDGELPEDAYLQRRAELKARLKDVTGSGRAG